MHDGTTDTLRFSFPADDRFARLGRVAVAGLALRLGVDVQRVENLRLAVDRAVEHLRADGSGEIVIETSWQPGRLAIRCSNEQVDLSDEHYAAIEGELAELVSGTERSPHGLDLILAD